MKRQPAQLRRHCEGDLDEIVEIGFAGDVAQAADIVRLQRPQGAETVEHHSGLGTYDVPAHLEQTAARRMEKEIDAFRLRNGAVVRESQRVDAVEGQIVTAADQVFEFGDAPRAPGPGLPDLGHLALKEPFLNVSHLTPHKVRRAMRPGIAAIIADARPGGSIGAWPSRSLTD